MDSATDRRLLRNRNLRVFLKVQVRNLLRKFVHHIGSERPPGITTRRALKRRRACPGCIKQCARCHMLRGLRVEGINQNIRVYNARFN